MSAPAWQWLTRQQCQVCAALVALGICSTTDKRLAGETGLSVRAVRRALEDAAARIRSRHPGRYVGPRRAVVEAFAREHGPACFDPSAPMPPAAPLDRAAVLHRAGAMLEEVRELLANLDAAA